MSCPELDRLEATPLAADVHAHVAACDACALVVEVFARTDEDRSACVRFDALLAARADGTLGRAGGNLLDRHLASCEACRLVADTLSPSADADGDHAALPAVDPAAYALGLEVARGGMGRILAARDLRVGRPVAVKELLDRSPQLAARFEREARVTARLQHPGIVPIYEIGTWPDGTPFYTMRMVDGRTLRDAIAAAPSLPERLALLPALLAACEAVAFAHAQRVIHRDLTPANVLVGAYGETVVIDWGLAKDLAAAEVEPDGDAPYRAASSGSLTSAGAVIGTAPYMPPEQAHAQPVDERADVYALGAILYHVLAGTAPYRGVSTAELLRAVKTGPPRPLDAVVAGAPRDLVSIAEKAMARDPEARYPTARELTEELKRFQTGRMVEAHAYSARERVRRFVKRHRGAVTATLLAAAVLAIIAAAAISRVIRSNRAAQATVRELLLEKGRVELLAGNTARGLAFLHEAWLRGARSPAVEFLLGSALRGLEAGAQPLDCGGMIRHVDFSPGGTHVAAACNDTGRIWELATQREVARLATFAGGFAGIRYAHDGARAITWGKDGVARLWDARTGALVRGFTHGAEITFARFTPDDAVLVTTGHDGTARIWDTATGDERRAITASTGLLKHLYGLLGGGGTHLLTLTIEGEGKGWDLATGALLGGFRHGALVTGGDLSRDGARAITCGVDHLAKVWDATTGAHLITLGGHTDVMWKCVFSPDGTLAITSGHDRRTNVWSVPSGALVTTVTHADIAWTGEIAPDNQRFTTVALDGRVKVWDLPSGALLATYDSVRGKDARFSPDGTHLVVQRGDARLQIWRTAGARAGSFAPRDRAIVDATRDGLRVVTVPRTIDGRLTLHDLATGAAIAHAEIHEPYSLAATRVAAASASGVTIVDAIRGTTLATLPIATPRELRLSGDGARLASASGGTWTVWDVATRAQLASLDGANALLSIDGRRAVTWDDATIRVWDVDARSSVVQLPRARDARPIGFSADGARLVVLESSRTPAQAMAIWNAGTGTAIVSTTPASDLQIGETQTTAVPAIDASGRYATTIRADQRITVWRLADGRAVSSVTAEHVLHADVRADGALIAAIGEYGKAALVLDATDGRILARWPIANTSPAVTQADFEPPRATAMWSSDGGLVVTRTATTTAAWSARSDDLARVTELVRRTVPYRVVNGRLELVRNGRLHGRVERRGEPVAGATVWIEIRIAPELGATAMSWDAVTTKITRRRTQTDDEGRFVLDQLVPGTYVLTVTDRGVTTAPQTVGVTTESDALPPIALP